jgi:hypothetical protein
VAPLPGSGQIDFASIQATFGGGGDIGFAEYYKGGAYVASNAVNPNGIPTGGQIAISNFWGAGPLSGQAYTLTVGYDKYGYTGYGGGAMGSMSSYAYSTGTAGGATINGLEWFNSVMYFYLTTAGTISNTDGVFSSIIVNGTTYNRSAATYSASSATYAQWSWSSGNPFGSATSVPVTIFHT